MFMTLLCRCANGHTWELLLPKYWFDISKIKCEECGKPVEDIKAGEPASLSEVIQKTAVFTDEVR